MKLNSLPGPIADAIGVAVAQEQVVSFPGGGVISLFRVSFAVNLRQVRTVLLPLQLTL